MDINDRFAPTNRPVMGHFLGIINASYAELVRAFGEPNGASDDYKVSTSWSIEDALTGNVFELYDYKETNMYSNDLPSVEEFRQLPSYDWRIGGHDGGSGSCSASRREYDEAAFAQFLTLKLGRTVVPGK